MSWPAAALCPPSHRHHLGPQAHPLCPSPAISGRSEPRLSHCLERPNFLSHLCVLIPIPPVLAPQASLSTPPASSDPFIAAFLVAYEMHRFVHSFIHSQAPMKRCSGPCTKHSVGSVDRAEEKTRPRLSWSLRSSVDSWTINGQMEPVKW